MPNEPRRLEDFREAQKSGRLRPLFERGELGGITVREGDARSRSAKRDDHGDIETDGRGSTARLCASLIAVELALYVPK